MEQLGAVNQSIRNCVYTVQIANENGKRILEVSRFCKMNAIHYSILLVLHQKNNFDYSESKMNRYVDGETQCFYATAPLCMQRSR